MHSKFLGSCVTRKFYRGRNSWLWKRLLPLWCLTSTTRFNHSISSLAWLLPSEQSSTSPPYCLTEPVPPILTYNFRYFEVPSRFCPIDTSGLVVLVGGSRLHFCGLRKFNTIWWILLSPCAYEGFHHSFPKTKNNRGVHITIVGQYKVDQIIIVITTRVDINVYIRVNKLIVILNISLF